MKEIIKITVFVLFLAGVNSCAVKKYPVRYWIYKGDKEINYPNSKIEIALLDETTGVFKNHLKKDSVFIQRFNYEISDSAFFHISNLDTINRNVISLNNNDTITMYKREMLYFYNGKTKYLLYFKKSKF
ncbi:hypothetical protein EYV94_28185 [Puteibacter caeruleilacunae]|nr:hypothetical protein EYV94_28185 [Puteibacter caeruleilacunae]